MIRRGKSRNAGFTLLELAVVVLVIGVVGLIIGPTVTGSVTNAKATQLQRIADTATSNWFFLTMQAGTGTSINTRQGIYSGSGTVTPPGPNYVLFIGRDYVTPAFQAAYDRSGVRPLDQVVARVGTTAQFTVVNFPGSTVDVTGGGPNPLVVSFGNIPPEVVLELVRRLRPGAAMVYGTATTIAQVTYNCPSAAVRCTSVDFSRRP